MAEFTNQATLSYGSYTARSNVTVGELRDALELTKEPVMDRYREGDVLTYVINLVNSETTDFTNVTVTDDMGAYTIGAQSYLPLLYQSGTLRYFVNGVSTPIGEPTIVGPLTITGITVPANGNVTLVYAAEVSRYAPLNAGGTITNTATASSNELAATASDTAEVEVAEEALLSISKSMNKSAVRENDQLTYTFIIQNRGNSEATAGYNVSVRDELNPPLKNLTATLDGAPFTAFTYTGNVFTTTPGAIIVPAGTPSQDPSTGIWTIDPGTAVLTITGTV